MFTVTPVQKMDNKWSSKNELNSFANNANFSFNLNEAREEHFHTRCGTQLRNEQ